MKFLFIVFISILLSAETSATKLKVGAEFAVSADYEELNGARIRRDGWKLMTNGLGDKIYSQKIIVRKSQLPVKRVLGPAYFSIDKKGLVRLGITIGDHDASSDTEFQLPLLGGEILSWPSPIMLRNTAGDHASGSWSFDGKLTIETLDR